VSTDAAGATPSEARSGGRRLARVFRPPLPSLRGRRRSGGFGRHEWWGLAFVVPMLTLFAVFKFWPMAQAFWLSLTSYDLLSEPRFVGWENYRTLLGDPLFRQSIWATTYYVAGVAAPVWVFALALALAFNRPLPGRHLLRLLYFLPVVMPAVVVAMIWRFIYHPHGLFNTALASVGLPTFDWLANRNAVMPAFIFAGWWRVVPYFMVIYLAGLQAIPRTYYEAAEIDGASALRRLSRITLPLLKPTILLVIVISVIMTSKVFVNALIMTGGGPDGATRVLPLFIYETGFRFFKMGLASAASVFLFAVVMIFTLVQFYLFKDSADRD
jgi:multiple sugar transport system permease protein